MYVQRYGEDEDEDEDAAPWCRRHRVGVKLTKGQPGEATVHFHRTCWFQTFPPTHTPSKPSMWDVNEGCEKLRLFWLMVWPPQYFQKKKKTTKKRAAKPGANRICDQPGHQNQEDLSSGGRTILPLGHQHKNRRGLKGKTGNVDGILIYLTSRRNTFNIWITLENLDKGRKREMRDVCI